MGSTDRATQLDYIFNPRSTAIIGASDREGNFGRLFLEGVCRMGYKEIFPIHPRECQKDRPGFV
jgi:acyl-CoA synthetase (NDP forming)